MKKQYLSILALLVAAPAFGTVIPDCGTQTMAAYDSLASGCSIGNLLFSNFEYDVNVVAGHPAVVSANQVTVTPVSVSGNPGFTFAGNWAAGSMQSVDYLIFYDVSTISGAPGINDAQMTMTGAVTGPVSAASVDEYLCLGGDVRTLCSGQPNDLLHMYVRATSVGPQSNDSIDFAPVSEVGVLKDILLGVGINGTANVSSVENIVSTPEPGMLLPAGIGLLFFLRRRIFQ